MQPLAIRPAPFTPALSYSSAPIGASTRSAIAGNVSQGDFAQSVPTAGTAVVQVWIKRARWRIARAQVLRRTL